MPRSRVGGPAFGALGSEKEFRRAWSRTIIAKPERVVGVRRRRTRAILIGRPSNERIGGSPANIIANQIRWATRPPDPMPELRRRLRELRGEA